MESFDSTKTSLKEILRQVHEGKSNYRIFSADGFGTITGLRD